MKNFIGILYLILFVQWTARYVLLTAKHHDGFCLLDGQYTDYDVASSPVQTDVIAEVTKAIAPPSINEFNVIDTWQYK